MLGAGKRFSETTSLAQGLVSPKPLPCRRDEWWWSRERGTDAAAGSGRGRHLGRFHMKNTWSRGCSARGPRGLGDPGGRGDPGAGCSSSYANLSQKACITVSTSRGYWRHRLFELLIFQQKDRTPAVPQPHWWATGASFSTPVPIVFTVGPTVPPSLHRALDVANRWLNTVRVPAGEASVRSLGWRDPLEEEKLPTPGFSPGESHGLRRLEGHSLCGCKKPDTTEDQMHTQA